MLQLRTVVGLCLFAALVVIVGCGKESPKEQPVSPKGEAQKTKAAAPAEKSASADKSAAELPEGLKELSREDLAAVKAQKVCPVSGEELGSMGKPYKVTVKGETFFLCCSGCEDDLMKNPDRYLAKLKKDGE